ncbi:MAG: FAD-dependent oxidoreductase [Halothece sp.]
MIYDLIIIGNTAVGRYAALRAVSWEARVALVTQEISTSSEADWLYSFSLTQLTQIGKQWGNIQAFTPPTKTYQEWAQEVVEVVEEETALVKLAAKGVDVIEGKGEFCRLPKQALVVNQEKLQAPAYLIATERIAIPPDISNLSSVGYLTLADLRVRETLETLPENLTIIGETPEAITLAQILARLNKQITLSIKDSRVFPTEDREISQWMQNQLEADGIKVLRKSPLLEIQKLETKKKLQLGKHTIQTDEIILFPKTYPNIEGLNLEGVRVNYDETGLFLNHKLQTANLKIYACGALVGGYSFFNIAQYEAEIALSNALFFPRLKVNYQVIPSLINTIPQIGRVGMTEAQAKRRYGNKIVILKVYFKNNLFSISQGDSTGILKLIVKSNGTILGGHCFGHYSQGLISVIALAMSKKMKVKQLDNVAFPSPSVMDLIKSLVQQWETYYYHSHPFLRELRKRYFFLRRP